MRTVRVVEVENVGGNRYTYNRYYNISDDTEITQLMHPCDAKMTDEECRSLTDMNWEEFKRKLEIDFPDTPQIEEYERQSSEDEDDILASYTGSLEDIEHKVWEEAPGLDYKDVAAKLSAILEANAASLHISINDMPDGLACPRAWWDWWANLLQQEE